MSRNRTSFGALMAASAFSAVMIDPAMASAARITNNVKNLDDFGSGASALTFASDGLDTTGSGSGDNTVRHHAAADLDSKMAMTSIADVGDDLGSDTTGDGTGHIAPS